MTGTHQTIDPAAAMKTAHRFARRLVARFDDEVESEANLAVAKALNAWAGEGSFDTYLFRCVYHELKYWLRQHAIRQQHECREIDLDEGSLDSEAADDNRSIWELLDETPDDEAREILYEISEGKGIREVEQERHWRNGTGVAKMREKVGAK